MFGRKTLTLLGRTDSWELLIPGSDQIVHCETLWLRSGLWNLTLLRYFAAHYPAFARGYFRDVSGK